MKLFILWLLCIVGAFSVLPYTWALGVKPQTATLTSYFGIVFAQSALLFGLLCALSYIIIRKTDLIPFRPLAEASHKRWVFAALSGAIVGIVIVLLSSTVFKSSELAGQHPPAWTGLLASIYGAINEEVMLRLFAFSLIYLVLSKIIRPAREKSRTTVLWTTNLITALIFGVMHLPLLFKICTPSLLEITRVLILNAIPGLCFGWLYFSYGIVFAMVAHGVTDLIIHVLLI